MDAVSHCEQIHQEMEGAEGAAPWRLFLRKEMFSPWESAVLDPVATSLVFAQVTRVLRGAADESPRWVMKSDASEAANLWIVQGGNVLQFEADLRPMLFLQPASVGINGCCARMQHS